MHNFICTKRKVMAIEINWFDKLFQRNERHLLKFQCQDKKYKFGIKENKYAHKTFCTRYFKT